MVTTAKEQGEQSGSLVGLFGHTYAPDTETPRATIRYQFKVVRHIDGGRYVVQMFSFVDGKPTNVLVLLRRNSLVQSANSTQPKSCGDAAYEADYERKVRLYEDTEAGRMHERRQYHAAFNHAADFHNGIQQDVG